VKDELERELAADELKRSLQDAQTALRDTEQQIRDSGAEAKREFDDMRAAVRSQPDVTAMDPPAAPADPVVPNEGEGDEPRNA